SQTAPRPDQVMDDSVLAIESQQVFAVEPRIWAVSGVRGGVWGRRLGVGSVWLGLPERVGWVRGGLVGLGGLGWEGWVGRVGGGVWWWWDLGFCGGFDGVNARFLVGLGG
ncbi:MAG: hypothetical protein KAT00_05125, partial [Planctomycetes bacterium]|nr:hypothetical protein [Planctomycetota bacterium]